MGARGGYDDEDDGEDYEEENEEDEGEYIADEEEEEDDEDEEDDRKKRKRKSRASKFIDDAADEDDDEDEEEQRPNKRKKNRPSASMFVDDQAGVDEDADEEDEMEAEDDFVVHQESSILESRRMAPRPPLLHNEDDGLENVAEMLRNRYSRQQEMDYEDAEATEVEQKALLPSVKDPKLWMLTCQQGREREAAACLMQKYLDLLARGEQLQIKSAVAIDHLKGFIYVEAEREAYVRQAVNGLRTIYPKTVHLVPIKEMTDVLTVEKKSVDIDKENWVRVKSGLYKDDLARVLDVDHVRQRARIKLVPRIDLPGLVAKMEGAPNKPKGFAPRPPPRFLNLQDLKDMKIPVDKKRDNATREVYEQIGNSIQLLKGYVIKNVSLKSLNPVESVPSLAELQKFQKPGEEDEVDALGLSTSARKKGSFMKGDTVEVIEGDLKFLMGTVEKVDEDQIEMRPKNSQLKDLLRFHARQLSKFFRTGDHVKVISGKHEGATGMILMVDNQSVVILSDTSKENIRVFKDSIVESSEVTSGLTRLGEFELHDLITLDQMTVGVIVRIEADGCQVLKGTPDKQEVVTVKQRDLRRRPFNKQANTQDRDMNTVSVKDIVRVVDGPFKGKQGPVEHISRGIIFIIDRHHLENGGFLCVRASSCVALGGSRGDKHNSIAARFASLKPPSQYLQSPRRSPVRGSYGPPTNGFAGRHGGGRRHDSLNGQIVKIRTGSYKGYRGRVKDVNGATVRIELESQMKIVSVRREEISDVGDNSSSAFSSSYKEPSRFGAGSETPLHPSRTPLHPSMTPMRDITATPLHEGMRTPMRDRAWHPFATTPLRDQNDDSGWGTSPQYMQQPGTPLATRSYEAPTPGSGWSPGASYSDSGSPVDNTYVPGTPGGLPMTPAAPSYVPGTPGGQPMTPGDPTSPTAFNMHESERQWALPEVIVTIRRHGESLIGVIQDVLPDGLCRVALGQTGDGEIVTASQSEMEMVPTRKNDTVKIVSGEFRGCSGKLIGIDGGEGIVRVDSLDVKILEMSTLGKKFERVGSSSVP